MSPLIRIVGATSAPTPDPRAPGCFWMATAVMTERATTSRIRLITTARRAEIFRSAMDTLSSSAAVLNPYTSYACTSDATRTLDIKAHALALNKSFRSLATRSPTPAGLRPGGGAGGGDGMHKG